MTRKQVLKRAFERARLGYWSQAPKAEVVETVSGIGAAEQVASMPLDKACIVFDTVLVVEGDVLGIYFSRGGCDER
jgi:hypothetical protein